MKRFLLFAGNDYYPCGGWEDFINDFDSFYEAFSAAEDTNYDWQQIVDTTDKTIYFLGRMQFVKTLGKELTQVDSVLDYFNKK